MLVVQCCAFEEYWYRGGIIERTVDALLQEAAFRMALKQSDEVLD